MNKLKIKLSEIYFKCEVSGCSKRATDHHHKYPNTKLNRKRYKRLLEEDFNIMFVCNSCNASHRNIPKEEIWSEIEFRIEADKRGFILPPISKSMQFKKFDFGRSK